MRWTPEKFRPEKVGKREEKVGKIKRISPVGWVELD